MRSYWFFRSVMSDVRSVAVEANVEGVLRFADILLATSPALDQVYQIFVLQVAVAPTWWDSLVTVLQNVVPVRMCWQVLQWLMLQGLVPSCAIRTGFRS